MKTVVKNITNAVICLSILAILLGIALVVYPGMSLVVLGAVVAAYLIVLGVTLVIVDIKAWRYFIPFDGLLPGILSVILGVLLAKDPGSIAAYIGIVMGVWIIVSSFGGIRVAAALRGTGAPWVLMIIVHIIDILIGGCVLYSPVLSSVSLTMGIGIVLIVHSVVNIVSMIMMKKNVKDLEQILAQAFKAPAFAKDADFEDVAEDAAEDAVDAQDAE